MDTDEFLKRSNDIMDGLDELADDLYEVVDEGITGEERESLISQSKEKIHKYDDFIKELDDDDIEEAKGVLERTINRLKNNVQKLELEE